MILVKMATGEPRGSKKSLVVNQVPRKAKTACGKKF